MSYVFGIDCGTQSLRAGLYSADGALVVQATESYETRRDRVNWAEQDPEDWWRALCTCVRRCLAESGAKPDAVIALACDATAYTGVYCRDDGTLLRPAILWMDLRATDEARFIEETKHPALVSCGRRLLAEWALPKALWLRRHEPETYAAADRIVEGVDWLVHRLTGRWVTSNSNASGKRHWSPDSGYPRDLYEAVGLPDLMQRSPDEVVYLGQPVANLLPQAAEQLGLTSRCIVAHAGMDGWTSSIGMNCFASGCASLTLGTSNVVVFETPQPLHIDGIMGPYPDGIRKGHYTYEAGQASGAAIPGWFVSLIGRANDPDAYRRLENEAAGIPPGSEGLVVFDAWRGNRTPHFDPLARGNICGLTLEHGPAHLYRAILEGCAFGLRSVVETLRSGGHEISEFRACGSGVANALWLRIIADVTGIPLLVSREKHATSLGSAMCAAVAGGVFGDLPAASHAMAPQFDSVDPGPERRAYDAHFRLYRETYDRMRPIMHELARFPVKG